MINEETKQKILEMFCNGKTGKVIREKLNLPKDFVDAVIKTEIERIKAQSELARAKSRVTTLPQPKKIVEPKPIIARKEDYHQRTSLGLKEKDHKLYLEVRKNRGLPEP